MSEDIARDSVLVPKASDQDTQYYSVTTIIKALGTSGDALLYWSAEQAAQCAIDIAKSLPSRIDEEGVDNVRKYLRDAFRRGRKGERTAAELGTAVHSACESYALNGTRPEVDDEVLPFVLQFEKWCQKFQPKYEAAEMQVYSDTYGYAGTCDAVLEIDGAKFIVDYKTSRKSVDSQGKETKPYPEVGLQLSAYRYADFAATWKARRIEKFSRRYYLCSDDERVLGVPIPTVDTGLAIHITPEHCNAYIIRCDDEVYRRFLFTIEAFKYTNEVSKTIIGNKLEPAKQVA